MDLVLITLARDLVNPNTSALVDAYDGLVEEMHLHDTKLRVTRADLVQLAHQVLLADSSPEAQLQLRKLRLLEDIVGLLELQNNKRIKLQD